ncbi:hypothetical protein, partial [Plasmodium yoelii yoelii]
NCLFLFYNYVLFNNTFSQRGVTTVEK